MRVLRVIPTIDPDVGGPSNSAVNAAIAESLAGVSTTLVFTGGEDSLRVTAPARERLNAVGVRTLMFPRPPVWSHQAGLWGLSVPLVAWLARRARSYDVIHVHYVWTLSTVAAATFGKRAGRRVVLTAHESLTRYDIDTASGSSLKRRLKLLVRRLVMRHIDVVVCASTLELRDSLEPGENGVVIAHPVVESPRTEPLPEPGAQLPERTVGYLGRLHPKKNVDVLLRSLSLLPTEYRLAVCGDGNASYRESLEQLATKLGVADRVEWRGHVDSAGRLALFGACHLTVMPSAYECFGMAAAEAMSAGLPVVVTDETGVASVVDAHRAGEVVAAGDADALAAAIVRISHPDGGQPALRQRALAASTSEFSFEAYGRAVVAVYSPADEIPPAPPGTGQAQHKTPAATG